MAGIGCQNGTGTGTLPHLASRCLADLSLKPRDGLDFGQATCMPSIIQNGTSTSTMLAVILTCLLLGPASAQNVPSNALVIDRLSLNNLETVSPPSVENLTTV